MLAAAGGNSGGKSAAVNVVQSIEVVLDHMVEKNRIDLLEDSRNLVSSSIHSVFKQLLTDNSVFWILQIRERLLNAQFVQKNDLHPLRYKDALTLLLGIRTQAERDVEECKASLTEAAKVYHEALVARDGVPMSEKSGAMDDPRDKGKGKAGDKPRQPSIAGSLDEDLGEGEEEDDDNDGSTSTPAASAVKAARRKRIAHA